MEKARQGADDKMRTVNISLYKYINKFNEKAKELAKMRLEDAPPVKDRNKQVEEMIEEYFRIVGSMPNPYTLKLLADYILISDLKNKDVDKVSKEEFPILSDIQLKRRLRKQLPMQDSTLEYLNTKYNKRLNSLSKTSIKKPEY